MNKTATLYGAVVITLGAGLSPCAHATELIYVPVNPSFGGNPLNGTFLLNSALAQDDLEDPNNDRLLDQTSDLEQFNETLQRSVLNRVAASVTASIIGPDGALQPGVIQTANFVIEVSDLGDGMMRIVTTDKATGESSMFEINSSL